MIGARVNMKEVAPILFIFGIGLLSSRAHADWADDRKEHLAASLEGHNGRLHEPFWASAGTKKTEPSHTPNDFVPTSSDFSEIRHSQAFVDKTFFLHEWLTHQPKHWYVTAPPGFGKSTLASMAVQFLNASVEIINGKERFYDKHKTTAYELFRGTKIFGMKDFFSEHFQNYAVVYIDLAPLSNTTEAICKKVDDFRSQDFHINFRMLIKKMMNYYPSLLHHESLNETERESFKQYLEEGMETEARPFKFWKSASFLMKILRRCLKKDVIVVVDSYDALCRPSMIGDMSQVRRPYIASYIINFSKMIIQDRLSPVIYFGSFNTVELMLQKPSERGIKTPTYTIKHTTFSSDERVAKYFGLSAQEVANVLEKYSMKDHLKVVDDLLNGHAVLRSPLTLFNTRSVLSYIENRNSTPSAVTLPLTAAFMRPYVKLFINQWISDFVTESIFKDKTVFMFSPQVLLSFASFTRLKHLVQDKIGVGVKENLKLDNTWTFIKFLNFLGLISIIDERGEICKLRASSRSDAELMNGYVYSSGTIQKFFKISAEDELKMIATLRDLAPTNISVQFLGEAIHNIVKMKVPEAEYQLKSLMYVFSRKVATYHSKDFEMEAGIAAPIREHVNVSGVGTPDIREKIDLILILKNKGTGIILTSKLNTNATSVLKEMTDHKYLDVLDSDPRFSKFKIKHKILIGVSVSQGVLVEIASEVWTQNEKTSLNHIILNGVN